MRGVVIFLLLASAMFSAVCCAGVGDSGGGTDDDVVDDDATDDDAADDDADDDQPDFSYRITGVWVESHVSYRVANKLFPTITGDLWPCAWGPDDRLYTANGDGFGFGFVWSDIVVSYVEGCPPNMVGATPPLAVDGLVAGVWGPESWKVSRKPTGMTCVDGDLYLFFQNLKNFLSDNEFGDAPHASISVSRDGGYTWEYDASEPMFTDHVFTTGFFLDYGRCQEYALDDYVYVYGLDYNWRFSPGFSQTKLYLARVPKDVIMERAAWEFFAGTDGGKPTWSADIDDKVPVLTDEELYGGWQSAIAQGSVVYIPQLNRYLYSSWADCAWIFYESPEPWGPWTKVSVVDWTTRSWDQDFHGGYATVIPTKFLDADGRGGWIISSILGFAGNAYYNMGMRRFTLDVEEETER